MKRAKKKKKRVYKLTCKCEAGLAANDGPEGVGGEALVGSSIVVFVEVADSQVASRQAEVGAARFHIDHRAVQFPPERHDNTNRNKPEGALLW